MKIVNHRQQNSKIKMKKTKEVDNKLQDKFLQ